MRTLTPDEVARVLAARDGGASWAQIAAVLADLDGCAWTGATLRYVATHPAPVRVQSTADADGSDANDPCSSVLEGRRENEGSAPPAPDRATRVGEPGGPTHSLRSTP